MYPQYQSAVNPAVSVTGSCRKLGHRKGKIEITQNTNPITIKHIFDVTLGQVAILSDLETRI